MTKTCWSTPTASSPVYMMFTQPSFDASTNSDISACKYTRCRKKTPTTYHCMYTAPSRHVQPSGFCHCWSVRLEQSPGPRPQSELHRSCFKAPAKDVSVNSGERIREVHPRCAIQIVLLTLKLKINGNSYNKIYANAI